jgi:hypothetical protein
MDLFYVILLVASILALFFALILSIRDLIRKTNKNIVEQTKEIKQLREDLTQFIKK